MTGMPANPQTQRGTHEHVIVYLEEPSHPKAAQPQKTLPNCPDHDLELKFYCETYKTAVP